MDKRSKAGASGESYGSDSGSDIQSGFQDGAQSIQAKLQSGARQLGGRRVAFIGGVAKFLNTAVRFVCYLLSYPGIGQLVYFRHRTVIPQVGTVDRQAETAVFLPNQGPEPGVTLRQGFVPTRRKPVKKQLMLWARLPGQKQGKQQCPYPSENPFFHTSVIVQGRNGPAPHPSGIRCKYLSGRPAVLPLNRREFRNIFPNRGNTKQPPYLR